MSQALGRAMVPLMTLGPPHAARGPDYPQRFFLRISVFTLTIGMVFRSSAARASARSLASWRGRSTASQAPSWRTPQRAPEGAIHTTAMYLDGGRGMVEADRYR